MKCRKCKTGKTCLKKGIRNGIQRFFCKKCNLYQQENYQYNIKEINLEQLIQLHSEGMSISGLSRFFKCSKNKISRLIKSISNKVKRPVRFENNEVYQLDEMRTYVGKNKPENYVYIVYAINKRTKEVVDYRIGGRTKIIIGRVVNSLKRLSPKKIITDKLNVYPNLIKPYKHSTIKYGNNDIERSNLNLRTHIRRLQRKTICYSKSIEMLEASIKLYFYWNNWCLYRYN